MGFESSEGTHSCKCPASHPWVSVVCRKFNWPHGRGLMGAATGLGADGCSARAREASSRPVPSKALFVMMLSQ